MLTHTTHQFVTSRYTAGVVIPKPVGECQYWHRSLSPKKLVEVGFSHLPRKSRMVDHVRKYKLPPAPEAALVPMTAAHVASAHRLVSAHLEQFQLAPVFSPADFAHWLLPRPGVMNTFVIVDAAGEVTDLCSFYELSSTVVQHPQHKTLRACYSYYNVATTIDFKTLIHEALVLAKGLGYDVYNCLDLMHNRPVMEDLLFGPGDGKLRYYLYNYRMATLKPEEVGLVLL